ncbi:MAG: ribosome maturation factor RimM [Leptolyngbya sp. BL-A-14]
MSDRPSENTELPENSPVGTGDLRKKAKARSKKAEAKKRKADDKKSTLQTSNQASLPASFLPIGKIVAAQGMKGEVRVYPESDFPERFLTPGTRWLVRSPATPPEPIELIRGRYLDGKGLYVVQFASVTDRTQAEALRDCLLCVQEGDRPLLEEGEFHVLDLIGLEVFDQATQKLIGTVSSIIQAGNDILEVERVAVDAKKPQSVLIPFVEAIVPIVDLQNRRIEITPPIGLIDSPQ